MNYELRIKKSKSAGYTLIETMIAVSIFLIIVMIGMNALLNANLLYNKSKDMRSIMDSLSFTMEDMSRNLRTGINYECIPFNRSLPTTVVATSGQNCGGIAFNPATGGTEWTYYIGPNLTNPNTLSLFKIVDGSTVQLTPDEVSIDPVSSFSVLGAENPSSGDNQQPFVTIHLIGTITYKTVVTPFSLQTSISQRQLDM
jgi:prepilin-type N-terminal cleavage/methylation domain-containing protein